MSSLVFEQYTERLRRKRRSPHTVSAFATAARRLDQWLTDRGETAETASYVLLEEYFDTLPLAPVSRGLHLRQIQAAYNYAVKAGRIRHNPALDLEVEDPEPREPRIISGDGLRAIRERATLARDWVFFHLLAYTGMRRAEVLGLKWDDGDEVASVLRLEQQTIRVIGKGKKARIIPVHPALGDVLAEYRGLPGAFVVPSWGKNGLAAQTVQEMVKRLDPVYTPHDFRRTVNTSLRRNGVDESIRNRIMGWTPKDISGRYYDNVADPELKRAILKLYADDPI
jgi:integrase